MYGPLNFGDADTVLGIYKIVNALRLLDTWANVDYKKWFNMAILGYTVSSNDEPMSSLFTAPAFPSVIAVEVSDLACNITNALKRSRA